MIMQEKLKIIELFSGIQAQERSLRQLPIEYESVGVCDCDKDVLVSAAAMRFNLSEEIANYNFPNTDIMIQELQNKNIGYDFQKNKHTITNRTPIKKLKQYYISNKLLKNLGDISKVEKLPYADIVTYSSPCQSFSVAGKLAGAAKTCNVCGHKWDIDFSNPDYNYKCPVCGNTSLESTTSGLLAEVQRLLSISYQENTLPKYLLLENVKNLVGKKFKPQFDAWVKWLDSIGYNTYYKVLNAKNFGIPQNRERVFAISIRKDIDDGTFQFPSEIPLTTRLKDILETNVSEQYYISNERVNQILNSDFLQEKLRARNNTSDENPVRLTNIYGEQFGTGYAGNVWDKNGLSPTLQTAQGGNRQPLIVEGEPFIVASRGRNPDNPSDRTAGSPTEQRLEPNLNGTTNTIPTVAKDNYVAEPIVCEERRDEGIRFFKDDCCGTLRTIDACGDKRVLEPDVTTIKVRNQATEFAGCTDVAGTLMARDYKGFGNQEMAAVIENYNNVKYRIRKLTPTECWRLMGFTDEDCNRAAEYVSPSSLYKQAGNSIVTNCLIAIFYSLFYKDNSDAYSKYLINFNSHS